MKLLYPIIKTISALLFLPFIAYSNSSGQIIELKHEKFCVSYTASGVTFNPTVEKMNWAWQLKKVEGIKLVDDGLSMPVADGKDVSYHRGGIIEKYLFRNNSIEQQFVISSAEGLTGNLIIEGSINAYGDFSKVEGGWRWEKGDANVFLGDVFVYDADGKSISATMEVTSTSSLIKVSYDALRNAKYPVTIDPQIGTDDFVLNNDALRAYQPKLIFNSTDIAFFSSWTKYNGSGLARNEDIYGGTFTRSQVRSVPKTVDQACSYTNIRISKDAPSGSSLNSLATNSDVGYSGTHYLTVWEDFYQLSGDKKLIRARTTTGSNYVTDTISLFNDATFSATYANPHYPAVAGNGTKFLTAASVFNISDGRYYVLGKFVQWNGSPEATAYVPILNQTSVFNDIKIVSDASGTFYVAASTYNAIYYCTVDNAGNVSSQGSKTVGSNVGSIDISVNNSNSFLFVWSDWDGSKYIIKGTINGGTAFQIDDGNHIGAGKPSVAYNPDTNSWLVTWHSTITRNGSSTTMIWAREVYSNGTMNNSFPVSKQTRTSVSPTVAYDTQSHEFWIAWSGGGNKDQLLAQRWTNSMSDCTITMRQDTIRENNYLGTALTPSTDKLITSFYALNSEGDSIYPVDYYLLNTDTLQTAYLTTAPVVTTKPTSSLSDYYVTRNMLFYIQNDSINYEKKNRYNLSVYAQSETPGVAGRSSSQSKQIRVIDVNEMFRATFPTTVTFLEDDITAKIPFEYQSGDSLRERNSIGLAVTTTPSTLDAAPILKDNPSVPGGGHSDPFPRTPLLAKDTLLLSLKADANGTANLQFTLTDKKGGEWESLQVDNTSNYTISVVITPVNDAPTFTAGADVVINEDNGAYSSTGWASSISAGPPDESAQTLAFSVTNDHNSIFSVQPSIDALTGTLTFIPAADSSGIVNVRVRLGDNGGIANDGQDSSLVEFFTITINPVNDKPGFAAGSNQTKLEGDGAQTVLGWASSISKGPDDEATQSLTFNVTNLNNSLFSVQPAISTSGTLTYTIADDAYGIANVRVVLKDDGGIDYSGVDSSTVVNFTITVTGVNDAPSFAMGSNQSIDEDAGAQTVTEWAKNITSGPDNESGQILTFNLSNNNNSLFSVQPDVDEVTGDLTYTPEVNANGVATVSIRLNDDGGIANNGVDSTSTMTFTITVNSINDEPTFVKGADQSILEDLGPQTIAGWATGISAGAPDESGQSLQFVVTNDKPSLFSSQPSISSTGTLTYTSAVFGTATVSVKLFDDGGIANGGVDSSSVQTFTIEIIGVNDAPTFTVGDDELISEDTGAQAVINWAKDITAGPANESFQTLEFTLTNDNNSLFTVQPDIDESTGDLTYTPAEDANGLAIVRIRLKDDGGIANGGIDSLVTTFTITISSVNDAPAFTAGADQTILEDAGAQTLTNWAKNISAGPLNESSQTLTFTLTNDNNSLFSVQPAIDEATGTLTYTPADDVYGIANVRARLKDNGGAANGGIDSIVTSFTITIASVNDAPTFTAGADETILEDAGAQTVSEWAKNISAGPVDENSQTLTFTLTNDNNSLFTVQPNIDKSTGDLTYTPAADAYGLANVRVRLKDSGGIVDGGIDTLITTFTISITGINDAPSITAGADEVVSEDAGLQTITAWAEDISAGPANENLQNIVFSLTNDNSSLFTIQPDIDEITGTLTYTPADDAFGVANVRVLLKDNGGIANSGVDSLVANFTITVNSVNDAPTFTAGADEVINEDDGDQAVVGWATAISYGPSNENGQTLNFTVTNDNNALFTVQPDIDEITGTLTYTLASDAYGLANVSVRLKDDGGVANGGVDTLVTTFTITVNSVNDAPVFTAGEDEAILEDAGAQSVTGWADNIGTGSLEESLQTLTFTVTNDNNSLFTVQPDIDETTGTLTFTPADDAFGMANVRVRLKDDGGIANGGVDSLVTTFTITITSVNDAPTLTASADEMIMEDAGAQSVVGWATNIGSGPSNESTQAITLTVTNDNNSLFSVQPNIDKTTGTLTYTPATEANGIANVRIRLKDDGGIVNDGVDSLITTFTITVTEVNDAPAFTAGSDETVLEDAGAQTITGWARDISAGPTNEASQTLTFSVSNNNTDLFSVQPDVDEATGTLTFTPAADIFGSATVSVKLSDNGGIANNGIDSTSTITFLINVTGVNDVPSFTAGTDQTVLEDGGPQTVVGWAKNIESGPSNENTQTLSFSLTNDNTSLFSIQPLINETTGTLSYTPVADANGMANVRVRLKDNGGIANGGIDTLITTFSITVTSVNDAPGFVIGADEIVVEDAGVQTVTGWATNISKGPSNESSQILSFVVTNDNNALFSVQPEIDEATGDLTYTPASNSFGNAKVSVQLKDNGGIANGGIDSTSTQTFEITVDPVNDKPVAVNSSISMSENEYYYFDSNDFGFADIADVGDVLDSVNILAAPGFGHLLFAGDTVTSFPLKLQVAQLSDLAFKPIINKYGNPYATLTFKVGDNNSTLASNGKLWSTASALMNVVVINSNQPPTDILLSRNTIDEDTFGAKAGKLTCVDPDPDDVHVYTITQNYNNLFEIVNDTLKLKNSYAVNYETVTQFQLQLKVTDGDGAFFLKNITIGVNNLNDTPVSANIFFDSSENVPYFLNRSMFPFTDEDAGDALTSIEIDLTGTTVGKLYRCPSGIAHPLLDEQIVIYPVSIPVSEIGNVYFFAPEGSCSFPQIDFKFRVGDKQLRYTDSQYTATTHIYCINHAPMASSQKATILSNEIFSFEGKKFGFYDAIDHLDRFDGIEVVDLPSRGKLLLYGVPVVENQVIDEDEIEGLTYQSAPWGYGVGYADFMFRVKDRRISDHGFEPLFSNNAYVFTFDVTQLNFPPIAQSNEISISEDETYTFKATDFNFSDTVDVGDALSAVQIFFERNPFVLLLDGAVVTNGTVVPVASIPALTFVYSPAKLSQPIYQFRFNVLDNNSVGAPNGKQFSTNTNNFTIHVLPVNHVPVSEDIIAEIHEDQPLAFDRSMFVFNDVQDVEDEMSAIVLEMPVVGGQLKYRGAVVTAKRTIPVTSLGEVAFVPSLNLNGENVATVKFRVVDNNSVGSPSGNKESGIYSLNISIVPVNDPPLSNDKTVAIVEGGAYHFNNTSFFFNDTIEPDDQLSSILITRLPSAGTLTFNGETVVLPVEIPVVQLIRLTYSAPESIPAVIPELQFKVKDNNSSGSENGNQASTASYSFWFEVVNANHPPVAVNRSVEMNEDNVYHFSNIDFGFNDTDNGDALDSIQITSLSVKGQLSWNNTPVIVGFAMNITEAANLIFTPDRDESGNVYAQIGFKVKDNNSLEAMNGGLWSYNIAILSIDVLPVNDAPVIVNLPDEISVEEFSMLDFSIGVDNFFDAEGDPLTIELEIISGNWIGKDGDLNVHGFALPTSDNTSVVLAKATDSDGASVEKQIRIVVERKQRPLVYGQLTCAKELPSTLPVVLFSIDETSVDTLMINNSTYGYYYFEAVSVGNYLVKAINKYPVTFPAILSTYFTSTLSWELADEVIVTVPNEYLANIELLTNRITTGSGEVSGKAFATESEYNPGTIATGTGTTPLPYVDIFLRLKGTDEVYLATQTDINGDYKITGIPDGAYIVAASIPGFGMIGGYDLVFGNGSRSYLNKNFVAYWSEHIVTGKKDLEKFTLSIYPNPTSGLLKLRVDNQFDQLQVRVLNLDGKVMLNKTFDKHADLKIDIGYLPKSEYLIEVQKDKQGKIVRSIVLK